MKEEAVKKDKLRKCVFLTEKTMLKIARLSVLLRMSDSAVIDLCVHAYDEDE